MYSIHEEKKKKMINRSLRREAWSAPSLLLQQLYFCALRVFRNLNTYTHTCIDSTFKVPAIPSVLSVRVLRKLDVFTAVIFQYLSCSCGYRVFINEIIFTTRYIIYKHKIIVQLYVYTRNSITKST